MVTAMTPEEMVASFREVSNWGRWGPDDELGTLNFITPAAVRRAAALVRSGRVVSAGHDLSTVRSAKNVEPLRHRMVYRGVHPHNTADEVLIYGHGLFQTHLDAVTHCFFEGQVYNGRSVEDVVLPDGLAYGSIHAMRNGIVTRGVLLDIARSRRVDWLDPTDTVTAADLNAAERLAGVTVESGDAVLVRIGLGARERANGPEDPTIRAGLGTDCPQWFHKREVAVFASDCPEKRPAIYPDVGPNWHTAALVFMGLTLVDTADCEAVADACAEEGRNEFLFTAAPLRLPRATGCAVNPICVF